VVFKAVAKVGVGSGPRESAGRAVASSAISREADSPGPQWFKLQGGGCARTKKEGSRPLLVVAESGGKRSRRYSEPVSRSFEEWCQTAGPSIGKIHGATRDSARADWLSLASSSALASSCPLGRHESRTSQRADGRENYGAGWGFRLPQFHAALRIGRATPARRVPASRAAEPYLNPRGQFPEWIRRVNPRAVGSRAGRLARILKMLDVWTVWTEKLLASWASPFGAARGDPER